MAFFLIFLFGVRFVVEYVKESQGGIENYLGLLTTGQWLSIPFMLIGLIILLRSNLKRFEKNYMARGLNRLILSLFFNFWVQQLYSLLLKTKATSFIILF